MHDIIAPGQVRFDGFVSGGGTFPYKIEFENKATVSAPAQVVHVTHTLDADLDRPGVHTGKVAEQRVVVTGAEQVDRECTHCLLRLAGLRIGATSFRDLLIVRFLGADTLVLRRAFAQIWCGLRQAAAC